MKDPYEVLQQKEADLARVRHEFESLQVVASLLSDDLTSDELTKKKESSAENIGPWPRFRGDRNGRSVFRDRCFAPKLLEGSEAGKVVHYWRLTPSFCLYEDRWLEVSVLDGSSHTYLRPLAQIREKRQDDAILTGALAARCDGSSRHQVLEQASPPFARSASRLQAWLSSFYHASATISLLIPVTFSTPTGHSAHNPANERYGDVSTTTSGFDL